LYVFADPTNHRDPTGHGIFNYIIGLAPAEGVIAVIGRRAAVAAYNGQIRYETLEDWLEGVQWSQQLNEVWIQTVINGRQVVLLASNLAQANLYNPASLYNGGFTYFGVELGELLQAGYVLKGGSLSPPPLP
jgi:hypothetical protein